MVNKNDRFPDRFSELIGWVAWSFRNQEICFRKNLFIFIPGMKSREAVLSNTEVKECIRVRLCQVIYRLERIGGLRKCCLKITHDDVMNPVEGQPQHLQPMMVGCPARCIDRKSTRLNSSHVAISYAVFCLKKKKR